LVRNVITEVSGVVKKMGTEFREIRRRRHLLVDHNHLLQTDPLLHMEF
jgi:hypothetical protein